MNKLTVLQRPFRLLTITLGLALAGTLFGGLAGGAGLAIALFFSPHQWRGCYEFCEFAASVGAVLGMVGAPAVAWVMLRRVPLGRLFTLLTLGTTLSAVFGWFAFSQIDVIWGPTFAGFVGFMATAIALSFRYDDTPRLGTNRSISGMLTE
ncbi:MAG TPA: hypothetical protein VER96_32275 [Polyangiaceae bacterium]|nr:hypothetical protein [Polyangiaceae bacterium]